MIISIHQPNFLPYLGYFEKIALADVFVLLDNVQYSKGDWHNRNYVKNANGKCPLHIPTSVHFQDKLNEVKISEKYSSHKVWNTIKLNYCRSPYYELYEDLETIFKDSHEYLITLNVALINYIVRALGLKTKIVHSTDIGIDTNILRGTNLILAICEKLKADCYLSGICGKNYLDFDRFYNMDIELVFQNYQHPTYKQRFNTFIPNLSIVDLIFNNGSYSSNLLITKSVEEYINENQ